MFGGPPRARPAVLPMPDFAELHQQWQLHPHLTQFPIRETGFHIFVLNNLFYTAANDQAAGTSFADDLAKPSLQAFVMTSHICRGATKPPTHSVRLSL